MTSMPEATYRYVGDELELFQHAQHWKAYLRAQLAEFLRGDVLEVGAGKGATTQALCGGGERSWLCLEPDASLVAEIEALRESKRLPGHVAVRQGQLQDLTDQAFDCILYVDVLEHIEDDLGELARAAVRLKAAGTVIVISPAHQWLYSPFDRDIGHFRRYSEGTLRALTPANTLLERFRYLDSVGIVASLANRLLLRAAMPTQKQIAFWDQRLVPLSQHVDPILRYRLGKSVLAVWRSAS